MAPSKIFECGMVWVAAVHLYGPTARVWWNGVDFNSFTGPWSIESKSSEPDPDSLQRWPISAPLARTSYVSPDCNALQNMREHAPIFSTSPQNLLMAFISSVEERWWLELRSFCTHQALSWSSVRTKSTNSDIHWPWSDSCMLLQNIQRSTVFTQKTESTVLSN